LPGKKREIRFFLSGVGPKRKIKRGLNALHAYRYKLVRLDLVFPDRTIMTVLPTVSEQMNYVRQAQVHIEFKSSVICHRCQITR
jgi:hypothetical protein